MKTLETLEDLSGKKVLVRADFNVPLGADRRVDETEGWRLRAALPTINFLLERGAAVILMSHLGRPNGKHDERFSLEPVRAKLMELLGKTIIRTYDCKGDYVRKSAAELQAGEIMLLENLRFYPEEENNDAVFARELAALGDLYVNEAFSVCHRAHASVAAITEFLPAYAGLGLAKEIQFLGGVMENPTHPATIIIGGLKAETKLPVISHLLPSFDYVLTGGVVANFLLKAKGVNIGKSVLDDLDPQEAERIDLANPKIHLPVDALTDLEAGEGYVDFSVGDMGDGRMFDVGGNTLREYLEIIRNSKTIVWNGTVGKFEEEAFAFGTREIARALAESSALTIAGGGDTISALEKFGYVARVKHISTGGGAMLKFLAGKSMPGISALG